MDKIDSRKLALLAALGAMALGGLTFIVALLIVCYSIHIWVGILSTVALLIALGGIILNILEDNERGY